MWSTPTSDTAAPTEALFFEIPEVSASYTMATTVRSCCQDLGIPFTTVDVWADPEAVLAHRVLVGPTIILSTDGTEIGRLVGPSSYRRVKRFLARASTTPKQALVMAAE